MMSQRKVIRNGLVVRPQGVDRLDVIIQDKIISKVAPSIETRNDDVIIDAKGKYILPGFVDVHNHGARGFDTTYGSYQRSKDDFSLESDAVKTSLNSALEFYRSCGVTKTLLTTIASPEDKILQSLTILNDTLEQLPPELQHICAGINIEGTFLKMPEYAGAQNPAFFADADVDLFERLNRASGDRIKMVNVPPEHGDEGIELIAHARKHNIAVAGGHTGSSFNEFSQAVQKGLSLAVHFFNGPSKSSSKSFEGGGAEEAMLFHDEVSLELILDGYHVSAPYVRDAIARKGYEGIVGITDSMFVNGLADIDRFKIAGMEGAVSHDASYLHKPGGLDTLFGSVLTMDQGFANLLTWLTSEMTGFWHRKHDALTLENALVAASTICSRNPASQIGMYGATGSIEVGKYGDLLIADIARSGNTYTLNIAQVFCQGSTE